MFTYPRMCIVCCWLLNFLFSKVETFYRSNTELQHSQFLRVPQGLHYIPPGLHYISPGLNYIKDHLCKLGEGDQLTYLTSGRQVKAHPDVKIYKNNDLFFNAMKL